MSFDQNKLFKLYEQKRVQSRLNEAITSMKIGGKAFKVKYIQHKGSNTDFLAQEGGFEPPKDLGVKDGEWVAYVQLSQYEDTDDYAWAYGNEKEAAYANLQNITKDVEF